MSFRPEDLVIDGAEVGASSEDPAWWRVRIQDGPYAPGRVLVLTDARVAAGLSSGEVDDEIRFRGFVADALNQMLQDIGEADLLAAAQEPRSELRLARLTF
jgi:hypothetical protein